MYEGRDPVAYGTVINGQAVGPLGIFTALPVVPCRSSTRARSQAGVGVADAQIQNGALQQHWKSGRIFS
jgi:hypothetical protein